MGGVGCWHRQTVEQAAAGVVAGGGLVSFALFFFL
jgi:hypothetical protein